MAVTVRTEEEAARSRANSVSIHVTRGEAARNAIGSEAPRDMVIACGFGIAVVTRNGKIIIDPESKRDDAVARRSRRIARDGWVSVADVDRYLRNSRQTGRFRIEINAPLWSATWQRKKVSGRWKWLCIKTGMGLA